MRKRPIYKIGALLLSVILIACGTGTTDEATSDKINVLVTTPMLGDFVNEIGGENINLTILMPAEVDPHTYDPSPQDASKIADADIVFYVGLKYEPSALIKLVENTSNEAAVLVEVGEEINPIEFSEEGHKGHDDHDDEDGHDDEEGHDDHDDEDGHEGHGHGSEDPHFWFDPLRVAIAAELMINQLIELDPSNSEAYKTAGEAYISELNELDSTVSALIETVPSKNRKLITTHESLGYLEARYGVEVLTTIIPSLTSADEISPAQLVDVLDVIEDNDVKVIFIESEAPSVYAETISAEANIRTVTGLWVETLRENQSYSDWLTENVELIVENLVDLP
ncbi:metal ABC transporter substrate-binding protein [Acidimicrobiia bacterium]|nr:metal ABC transporter substrate-binding protein [Acidimicrobiia bacterium]MDC0871628.1 metal ABC transporter substrate-binding protein [Acidimicrobiia bacterium]MDC3256664.1 metal ABC transporter substrate-binding protein [Acidimicrobiia bacterium]MDC3278419.1 metal ABC transporter substrate-binding protein [Acidimicrobiia bacterium]MDC3314646.1 metal ABC transporter substrate-binding protein [Acidimicrobiia bacterium]